ncbi:hypothetical protein B0I31_102307 [Saccharothrix carnea]|uniref:Uncharacterized protein n=1 Tax=Saccharothrix carnea TaxID=1280637 RepID=A0A2P8IFS9_SACCR|nr:hypothetical protein B0I31_102307 [Saccharothrix carnea]
MTSTLPRPLLIDRLSPRPDFTRTAHVVVDADPSTTYRALRGLVFLGEVQRQHGVQAVERGSHVVHLVRFDAVGRFAQVPVQPAAQALDLGMAAAHRDRALRTAEDPGQRWVQLGLLRSFVRQDPLGEQVVGAADGGVGLRAHSCGQRVGGLPDGTARGEQLLVLVREPVQQPVGVTGDVVSGRAAQGRRLHRRSGPSRPQGDPDVRGGQGRRVVDPVAHHDRDPDCP